MISLVSKLAFRAPAIDGDGCWTFSSPGDVRHINSGYNWDGLLDEAVDGGVSKSGIISLQSHWWLYLNFTLPAHTPDGNNLQKVLSKSKRLPLEIKAQSDTSMYMLGTDMCVLSEHAHVYTRNTHVHTCETHICTYRYTLEKESKRVYERQTQTCGLKSHMCATRTALTLASGTLQQHPISPCVLHQQHPPTRRTPCNSTLQQHLAAAQATPTCLCRTPSLFA